MFVEPLDIFCASDDDWHSQDLRHFIVVPAANGIFDFAIYAASSFNCQSPLQTRIDFAFPPVNAFQRPVDLDAGRQSQLDEMLGEIHSLRAELLAERDQRDA